MSEAITERVSILVAEDQPEVQHALQLLLKTAGYTVELASSPQEALDAIARTEFDLLLMDLNYHRDTTSGAEGLKLLEDLRVVLQGHPVVVMTAWGSVDLAVEAMHHGACDFIQKPWDNDHLLRIVAKHIEGGRSLRRQRRRQQLELQDAVAVQRRLLPTQMPSAPGISIAGECRPAGDMGGDYFDVFTMGSKIGICIADVIGKGLPAALMMSNLQAAVKVTAADWVGPAELCGKLNSLICKNGAADKFISLVYAVLDPATGEITYCNCGHNAPLLRRADGHVERFIAGGTVLGIDCNARFVEETTTLRSGDQLVLFTDGVTEAGMGAGEEYGEDRLVRALSVVAQGADAKTALDAVLHDVSAYCRNNFEDDVTCVIVSVDGAHAVMDEERALAN